MDFALLPPEMNSGRMYAGPGSGPMLAAAAAWDGLAVELHSTATAYGSVLSELSAGPWLGAASAAMTAAAAPYVAWMSSTATQAEQTATQAKAAAAAFEVTFAAMVPPPVIEANRALLQALVATNLFGQNTPAIAATEALYAEMWAQDATAMYGYAGTSATATTLTPFTPAPQTTNGTSPAASQVASTALQGIASTTTTNTTSASVLDELSSLESNELYIPNVAQAGLTPLNTASIFTDMKYDDSEQRDLETQGKSNTIYDVISRIYWALRDRFPEMPLTDLPTNSESVMAAPSFRGTTQASAVTGGLGRASLVGGLSVPQGWTVAAPEIRLASATLPITSLGAVSVSAAPGVLAVSSPGTLLGEMTLANMASRALTGDATRGCHERTGSIFRSRSVPATTASPTGKGATIAADVHEFAEALIKLGDLRDSGLLTNEEFIKEKERLLAR